MSLVARSTCPASLRLACHAIARGTPAGALRRRLLHSNPTTTTHLPQLESTTTPKRTDPGLGSDNKRQRNKFFREAFTRVVDEDVEAKLSSPFVSPIRDYPSAAATEESRTEALQQARTQVGFDTIWGQYKNSDHRLISDLDWTDIFEHLKRTTGRMNSKSKKIAAMRIVLPDNWDLDVSNRNVDFIDSITGLSKRLRVSMDHHNPSAVVLRGQSGTLAKAADELLGLNRHVKIFQLGEVADFDYETKQLWPAISEPSAADDVPADSFWVHREQPEEQWIETRYEDIPRPETWTTEGFESYITTLVRSRLRPHLAVPLYSSWNATKGRAHEQVDTNGARVDLIMDMFMDESARPFITAPALNTAIAFLSRCGGHRASADRLFKLAEEWGVPMDTETFNIMLEGYVAKRDFRYFYMFLRKMRSRYFAPNPRTWLLFLQLLGKDDLKRQIVVAMYELNLFANPATGRGIAAAMIIQDSYTSFRSGKKLDEFVKEQQGRYGDNWLSREALNGLLREYFRFHGASKPPPSEYAHIVESTMDDGRRLDAVTVNIVLEHCVRDQHWDAALWILDFAARNAIELDQTTYLYLITLGIASASPRALEATFFYGSHEFKLRTPARRILHKILTVDNKLSILTGDVASALRENPIFGANKVVSRTLRAIITGSHGMVPAQPLATTLSTALQLDGEKSSQPLVIEMKDPNDDAPTRELRLDHSFDPRTMVANTRRRRVQWKPILAEAEPFSISR